jgi:HAD superfamily phosphatase
VVDYFNEVFIGNNGDGLIRREQWFPRPGLLERLAGRHKLALFTGRLQYEAEITLRRFAPNLIFDPLLCAEHVIHPKPAPDGLLDIQSRHPGAKLWYVGDTVDDARSALAAGVPFIGVVSRQHATRDEILSLFELENAAAIVENVNEIESIV